MASCSQLEDEEDEEHAQEDAQKASSSNTNDRVLIVFEALLECMSQKEIFQLPEEMREQVVATKRHAKSYANKVKEVKEPAKLDSQMTVYYLGQTPKPSVAYRWLYLRAKTQMHPGKRWLHGQHHA